MKTKIKLTCLSAAFLLAFINSIAQSPTQLVNFSGGNGANPQAGLVASGNVFFGTTYSGGNSNAGTVFTVNTSGMMTTLYHFNGAVYNTNTQTYNPADGENPIGTLVLAGTTLYGTTSFGGTSDSGTVFSVNTNGSNYSVLYSFTGGNDGAYPEAGLALISNTLFGTTFVGGTSGQGAVFRIDTNGQHFTNIFSFTGNTNGANPEARLLASGNTLYGTTYGPYYSGTGHGTVFKMNTDGSGMSNVYSFTGGGDGAYPEAGLILAGSTLYGTVSAGGDFAGSGGDGTVFSVNTNGSGFHATALNFGVGSGPRAELLLVGSTLYGTTVDGGSQGYGAIFQVNTSGSSLANLYSFLDAIDGANPEAHLTLAGSTLYGTTQAVDFYNFGTVFGLTLSSISPALNIAVSGNQVTLTWSNTAFSLQTNSTLSGQYGTISGSTSPYATNVTNKQLFFRLKGN